MPSDERDSKWPLAQIRWSVEVRYEDADYAPLTQALQKTYSSLGACHRQTMRWVISESAGWSTESSENPRFDGSIPHALQLSRYFAHKVTSRKYRSQKDPTKRFPQHNKLPAARLAEQRPAGEPRHRSSQEAAYDAFPCRSGGLPRC
jgi:hypothetical protein